MCELKPVLLVPVVAVLIALGGVYAYSVSRLSADLLLIQSLHGSSTPVRAFAAASMWRFNRCPEADFAPSTAIGMLVAAWDEHVPAARAEKLLERLQGLGCDINRQGARGLTPLHSAVLFNNLAAVETLLKSGANPQARVTIASADGGSDSVDVPGFAARLATVGDENFDAVIAALARHQPQ